MREKLLEVYAKGKNVAEEGLKEMENIETKKVMIMIQKPPSLQKELQHFGMKIKKDQNDIMRKMMIKKR